MSSSSRVVSERKHVVPSQEAKPMNYAYHAHHAHEVLTVLGSRETGLTRTEAKKRGERQGKNEFTKERGRSWIWSVITQLRSPLAFVLVLAFLVTLVLAEYVDASVILFALLIAVVVGVLQEGKASRAFAKLTASQTRTATVLRDEQKHEIKAEDLVVGDVVVLQSGVQVPADMRLVRAKQLSINEAPLTGEWRAEEKHVAAVSVGTPFAEQASMAWMGTFVAEGYGMGVVTAIGDNTAVGQLASSLREVEEVSTPLQDEMERVSKVMLSIIVVIVAGIFVLGVWQGNSLHEMLLMAIAVAVASVPEGLPAAVTIILAVGMEALLKRDGLVRNLLAAETLGSTTYVLTDKTGTLTEAKMAITSLLLEDGRVVARKAFKDSKLIKNLFSVSLAAIDAYVDQASKGKVLRGDPVEQAILAEARELGVTEQDSVHRRERIDYLAFTSEQRFAAGLTEYKDERFVLCVNGAPGELLKHATHQLTRQGEENLTNEAKQKIEAAIAKETSAGKRLVAVGYRYVEYDDIPEDTSDVLEELIFVGVLVLDDPVRKGVEKAIKGVQAAGAEVILVTGDNPQTALSVAAAVGIVEPTEQALTGDDLERMSDDEILVALEQIKVYARVLPTQKLRLATLLQQKGEVVAMTGDGINDAPALRRANIGIAIGSGTEVAKEASDLVLVKDSFATIYAAIEEGRRIIANLRKIVGYLLSTSLSEVVLITVALLVGAPAPLVPAQILWANVIEEGLMSVAFAFEPGEKDAMKRRPQDIHAEGILSREMVWFMALAITALSLLTIALYFYVRSLGLPLETIRSVMFLSISMDSLFMAFAFRSLTTPIWKISLVSNKFFIGSFLLSISLLIVVLTVPFFQFVLSYEPLPLDLMALVVGFSLVSLAIIEAAKWVYFERKEQA